MKTLPLVGLVVLLFLVAGGYMSQRALSLRLIWRQARQDAELRVMVEKRDQLKVEIEQLAGFERLDSIWTVCGRPSAAVPAVATRPDTTRNEEPGVAVDIADSRGGPR